MKTHVSIVQTSVSLNELYQRHRPTRVLMTGHSYVLPESVSAEKLYRDSSGANNELHEVIMRRMAKKIM